MNGGSIGAVQTVSIILPKQLARAPSVSGWFYMLFIFTAATGQNTDQSSHLMVIGSGLAARTRSRPTWQAKAGDGGRCYEPRKSEETELAAIALFISRHIAPAMPPSRRPELSEVSLSDLLSSRTASGRRFYHNNLLLLHLERLLAAAWASSWRTLSSLALLACPPACHRPLR